MFKYEIEYGDSVTKVLLTGDMDIDVTELMEEGLPPQLLDSKSIELDFSEVYFVDSSGIGLLMSFVMDMQKRGADIRITHLTSDVKHIFAILQLSDIFGSGVIEEDLKAGRD